MTFETAANIRKPVEIAVCEFFKLNHMLIFWSSLARGRSPHLVLKI
jgi:hypothetical protein